jgi:hypothetical protein
MSLTAAFAPVFVQVALTFVLLFRLGVLRLGLWRDGTIAARDYALGQAAWPPTVIQTANAFHNQFELPVLFYLVAVLAFMAGRMSGVLVVLAWLFVVARLLHALVYVTTNNVPRRFSAYTASFVVLVAMWLVFLVDIVSGS